MFLNNAPPAAQRRSEEGPAREAYLEVVDAINSAETPLEQNRLAVLLLGTQYEDLAPGALDSLSAIDEATVQTAGKTDELVATTGATTSEIEMMWRDFKTFFGTFAEGFASIVNEKIIAPLKLVGDAWGWVKDQFTEDLSGSVDVLANQLTVAEERAYQFQQRMDVMPDTLGAATQSTEEHEAALKAEKEALEAEITALEASAKALEEKIDSAYSAASATYALRDAEDDHTEAVAAATIVLDSEDATLRDVRQALDEVAISAQASADAELRLAEETAAANGHTLTATQRQDILTGALISQAGQLNGPQRDAVLGHIQRVNDIPDESMTDIRALLAMGDIAGAERVINNTSRTREAAINATANTWAAENKINYAARPRTTSITTTVNQRTGTTVRQPGLGNFMGTGGAHGGPTLVGEQGPEIVNLERGDTVATNEKTKKAVGRGTTVNNYFNMPSGITPEQIAGEQRAYQRRNGVPL